MLTPHLVQKVETPRDTKRRKRTKLRKRGFKSSCLSKKHGHIFFNANLDPF